MTRWRMSTSSRADLASAPRTWRRPGPRSRALRIRAATMMSADASSISSASCWRASGSGVRARSRSTRASRCGRRTGAAARAEAGMACSRPTAPAMVSRSDSVQAARASTRRMAALLLGGAAEELVPEEDEDAGGDAGDGPAGEQQDDEAGAGGDRTALTGEADELGGPFARLLLLVLGLGGQSADRDGEQREAAADGDAAAERVQDRAGRTGRPWSRVRRDSWSAHPQFPPPGRR